MRALRHAIISISLVLPLALAAGDVKNPCGFVDRWVVEGQALKQMFAYTRDVREFTPPAHIKQIRATMSDGIVLVGYEIPCNVSGDGFVLVAQGNAMLASDVKWLARLQNLCGTQAAVYVFDYRATGLSRPSRNEMLARYIEDYRELYQFLSKRASASRRDLYGISAGGVLLLNAAISDYTSIVIDSTPDILPVHCWDQYFKPSTKLPVDAHKIMFIAGTLDDTKTGELLTLAANRGARIEHPTLPHAGDDNDSQAKMRADIVRGFFERNRTMQAEIVKNLAADHINQVDVDVKEGVVTLSGRASASDHDKALQDTRKVSGVKKVIDHISVQ